MPSTCKNMLFYSKTSTVRSRKKCHRIHYAWPISVTGEPLKSSHRSVRGKSAPIQSQKVPCPDCNTPGEKGCSPCTSSSCRGTGRGQLPPEASRPLLVQGFDKGVVWWGLRLQRTTGGGMLMSSCRNLTTWLGEMLRILANFHPLWKPDVAKRWELGQPERIGKASSQMNAIFTVVPANYSMFLEGLSSARHRYRLLAAVGLLPRKPESSPRPLPQ